MPDYEQLFPGRFLKGKTLEGPKTVRIKSVVADELEGERADEKKVKGILAYTAAGGEKGEIVLCKTNAILISWIVGTAEKPERDYSKWAGRLITIGFDPLVKFGSETPGGIRVIGSPELTAPRVVEIKFRKKRPQEVQLMPTGKPGKPKPQTDAGEVVPPPSDDATVTA